MARNKTLKANRLPLGKFLAWKSSDITSAGVFLIVTTYMSIFCTDYLGMAPLVVGNIILVSNIIDFFTDLIAAYVIDNTKTKWGKARPYELGAIGMTICTTLIFVTPNGWSDTLKIVWVFCMYTFLFGVFNTFRTSANVPYLIRAFDNNRTLIGKVSSYGGFVTTMGSMVVSLTFPKMMANLASSDGGWTTLILIYMIPLTLLGALRFIFVKENPDIDAKQIKNKVNFKDIWMMIKKNGYAWLYLLIMFFFQTIQSIGALSYYFKYVVGDEGSAGLLSIMSFVLLPVMFFFPLIMKKFNAAQIIAFGAIFSCLGYAVHGHVLLIGGQHLGRGDIIELGGLREVFDAVDEGDLEVEACLVSGVDDLGESDGAGIFIFPNGEEAVQGQHQDKDQNNGQKRAFFHISFHLRRWLPGFPEAGAYSHWNRCRRKY